MPYYRCPSCGLTVHSVAGRFTANICPNCGAPLAGGDQIHIEERHPAAISRRFEARPEAAAAARRELDTLLWNLDDSERHVLALLVTELIANSVEHSPAGPSGDVRLDIAVSDHVVRVEVRDDGDRFEPAVRTVDSPLDSHWGLHLVEELADRWEVADTAQTLVWFELDRVAAAGPLFAPAAAAVAVG
jgi:anti-sigma regulatory factor (Ser/Thr protein kinase)